MRWNCEWDAVMQLIGILCLVVALGIGSRGAVPVSADPSGAEEKPRIAITFDDGPNPVYTPVLLDGLKERNVRATFFLIGQNAEENPEIVLRTQEEGHLIGNHTFHHVELSKVSFEEAQEEIEATNAVISGVTGQSVEYIRPPFGVWKDNLEQVLPMLQVMWTVDPMDWATGNEDEIVNKVVTNVKENDIILLHDCYDSSVRAALRIIELLQAEGYEFVTVDELLMD
ncbi:polysaccharide deacetylase family protein [Hespellia stercorisuis]|nr:polysaccharide deacetylase family protein [Hespellia stercorisuis]